MSTQPSLFDICERKHGHNQESVAANQQIASHKRNLQAKVYELILRYAHVGITLKEIVRLSGIPINSVSGRISELKADGVVQPNGQIREGCAVLVPTFAKETL